MLSRIVPWGDGVCFTRTILCTVRATCHSNIQACCFSCRGSKTTVAPYGFCASVSPCMYEAI